MKEVAPRSRQKILFQTAGVWLICALLAMMVLDGGYILGFYFAASLLFWPGSWIYFRIRRSSWPSDHLAFRFGPLILFVLGYVCEMILALFINL